MYDYKAKVVKVVDGDTIDVEIDLGFDIRIDQRCRLYGVDTPETRTRNKKEKEAGLKSKQFVKDQLSSKDILIRSEEYGKFGRPLAIIFYENDAGVMVNLNKTLISNKLAKEYFGGKKEGWPEDGNSN
jgi:micrococcal nuclease